MNQLLRVITVLSDGKERTLRQIETECFNRFGVRDSQPAISARLREYGRIVDRGYERQAECRKINDKQVWFYSLSRLMTC